MAPVYGMNTKMKSVPGTRVAKVTVSIPSDLFAWGEEERARQHMGRSEFVASLYRRYRDELEMQERIARYRAAYGNLPETAEERTLTEASMQLLADELTE